MLRPHDKNLNHASPAELQDSSHIWYLFHLMLRAHNTNIQSNPYIADCTTYSTTDINPLYKAAMYQIAHYSCRCPDKKRKRTKLNQTKEADRTITCVGAMLRCTKKRTSCKKILLYTHHVHRYSQTIAKSNAIISNHCTTSLVQLDGKAE